MSAAAPIPEVDSDGIERLIVHILSKYSDRDCSFTVTPSAIALMKNRLELAMNEIIATAKQRCLDNDSTVVTAADLQYARAQLTLSR